MFHLICCGIMIKSYVLGEIPSLQDRVTIVRQLWNLTKDVLVKNLPLAIKCTKFFMILVVVLL